MKARSGTTWILSIHSHSAPNDLASTRAKVHRPTGETGAAAISASRDIETAIASGQGGLGLTGHNESSPDEIVPSDTDSVASVVDPSVAETNAPAAAKARKQKESTVLPIQPKTYREIKRDEQGEQGQGQGCSRQRH